MEMLNEHCEVPLESLASDALKLVQAALTCSESRTAGWVQILFSVSFLSIPEPSHGVWLMIGTG